MAKGTLHKHGSLIDSYFPLQYGLTVLKPTHMYTKIE